jgi:hypothetical protein
MAKQMNASMLIITNLGASVLPASVFDVLEIQTKDTAPAGKLHIAHATKSKADLVMWWLLLLHHQINLWPSLTFCLATITKLKDDAEMIKQTTCNYIRNLRIAGNLCQRNI